MIQISIRDLKKKYVLYFTLLAVIKFCPLQGHRCFHGDRYTLKPRREEKYKEGQEACIVAFHVLTEETELWNPGAGAEFMRPPKSNAHLQKSRHKIRLKRSKCLLFKGSHSVVDPDVAWVPEKALLARPEP